MIKRRLIPKLLLTRSKYGSKVALVTSVKFCDHIEIGDPVSQAKIYQAQMVDELLFLDIDASRDNRDFLLTDIIHKVADQLFMPLTVGGGVKSIDDFRALLLNGADKVSINTYAVRDPGLIRKAAGIFGSQCVVLAIDAKRDKDGVYKIWIKGGEEETGLDLVKGAGDGEKLGAGEILLTSIDNDGTRMGLDNELIKKVAEAVSIPVVASGGGGLGSHFVDGFIKGKADAIAAGTYFCFKDENPMQVRSQVKSAGIPIRIFT